MFVCISHYNYVILSCDNTTSLICDNTAYKNGYRFLLINNNAVSQKFKCNGISLKEL